MTCDLETEAEIAGIPDERLRAKAYRLHNLCIIPADDILPGLCIEIFGLSLGMVIVPVCVYFGFTFADYLCFFRFLGADAGSDFIYALLSLFLWLTVCGLLAYWVDHHLFRKQKAAERRMIRKLLKDTRLTETLMDHSPKLLADAQNLS